MNEDRLNLLDVEKIPYLFSSSHLAELLEITPSVKTRLSMILMLGPRLTDPKAKVDYFLNLFRFSEEKEKVQVVLKARTTVLASLLFRQSGLNLSPVGGYGVAAENTTVAKPFMNLKGMAAARERVIKPVGKSRASLSSQSPAIGSPLSLPRSESDAQKFSNGQNGIGLPGRHINNSSSKLRSLTASAQVTSSTDTLTLESVKIDYRNDDNDEFFDRMLNEMKEPQPTVVSKLPTSAPILPISTNIFGTITNSSPAMSVAVVTSRVESQLQTNSTSPLKISSHTEAVSPSEVGLAGKVKRMLKSHKVLGSSKFSPKYTSMVEGGNLISSKDTVGKTKTFEVSVLDSSGNSSLNEGTTNGNVEMNGDNGFRKSPSSSSISQPSSSYLHPGPLVLPRSSPRRSSSESHTLNLRMESLLKDTSSVNVKGIAGIIDRSKKGSERVEQTDTSDHNDLNRRIGEELDPEFRSCGANGLASLGTKKWAVGTVSSQDQSQDHIVVSRLATVVNTIVRSSSFNGINSCSSLGICTPRGTPIKVAWVRDKLFYQKMPAEGPVGADSDGTPLFRYCELVRKNFVKSYEGVRQSELEEYMIEEDFEKQFGMTKVARYSKKQSVLM